MEFLDAQHQILTAYSKTFNPLLVTLSVLIAVASSFTAFGISERINCTEKKFHRAVWIVFGAVSMGLGIWSMHFVGTLSLKLPIPISYDPQFILISLLPAFLASFAVLWLLKQTVFSPIRLLVCGVLLAAGICTMHFIGMMALEYDARIYFVPDLFALSIVIAVLFSTGSLYFRFYAVELSRIHEVGIKQITSAAILGLAVSGMHYTAMFATVFVPLPEYHFVPRGVDAVVLAGIVSVVIFLILLLSIVIPFALRYRHMTLELRGQEDKTRIAATAFQTHDAIMITNSDSKIIRVNNAFTRITGYSEQEVLNRSPRFLKSKRHDQRFYRRLWEQVSRKGQWCGEIWHKRRNDEIFPAWQTISTVQDKQGEITHYITFFSDITAFKDSEKEIERLAFFDPLTELPNRRLLNDHLAHELAVAKRHDRTGALLFLDLDHFKHINDSLGHSVGDEILKETARRLLLILRESDTAIRLGGDEYVVLITAQEIEASQIIHQAKKVAERILIELNRPYIVDSHELYISTSIGITLFTGSLEENSETILKQADTAMYQAKDAGRNTFRFYRASMQETVDARLILEKNLGKASANHEFSLYLQPQFSDDYRIIGAEALIRWSHPELGMVSPSEFIPVAEETGMILKIDVWMLQKACRMIKEYDRKGICLPHIAVNISPWQFHQPEFVSMIEQVVSGVDVQPNRIMLEITEGVFMKNFEDAAAKMRALRNKGFSFSIDDFGTGYSSLTSLKCLPFDQLKIDQSFVRDLVDDPSDSAIVRTIIAMAKTLGLNVVAEGVEKEEQFELLSRHGCNYFQGHFFSEPLPEEEFARLCKKQPGFRELA